jgi:hypothetical protein
VGHWKPPGWYPDRGRQSLCWWNGSSWRSDQRWHPAYDEQLYDVVLTSVQATATLRSSLTRTLGLSPEQAEEYSETVPCTLARHIPAGQGQQLLAAISGGGGGPACCTGELRPNGTVSALMRGPDPRFAQVEAAYRHHVALWEAGQITKRQLDQTLLSLAFDHGGRGWAMVAPLGRWFAWDGRQWTAATPPES